MLQILQPVVVFLLGLVCVAGLWALSAPASFLRLNRLSSTWVETKDFENKLSEHRGALDRLIYRHHFLSGFLLVTVSLSMLYFALFRFAGISRPGGDAGGLSGLFYDFIFSFACLAGVAGMIVGMIVFIRPSSLKLAESWGNRSVSLQPLVERLERRFGMIDIWVERHTRLFGGMVLFCALLIGLLIVEVMR